MTDIATPVIAGTLGIHVLSSKMGESVVVTLPDGVWFVVDAFSGKRVRNPPGGKQPHAVLSFIERFALRPEKCAFVLLTHLHQDHYEGIPALLGELRKHKPDLQLVRHSAYRSSGVLEIIGEHLDAEYFDLPRAQKDRFVGPQGRDVAKLFGSGCLDLSQWNPVHTDPNDCHVVAVAPAEKIVNRYYVPGVFASGLKEMPARVRSDILKKQSRILNDMSVAVCVSYGETCVLLAADCEVEAWQTLAENPTPSTRIPGVQNPLSKISFLKVPHHGSKRAWNSFLEDLYGPDLDAVVTHHQKGKNLLPDLEGLDLIRRQGTGLAVPDRSWLPEEAQREIQNLPNFTAVPVYSGLPSAPKKAGRYRQKYGANIRPAPKTEVAWVSTSFGNDGSSSGHWFGGSNAGFLPRA